MGRPYGKGPRSGSCKPDPAERFTVKITLEMLPLLNLALYRNPALADQLVGIMLTLATEPPPAPMPGGLGSGPPPDPLAPGSAVDALAAVIAAWLKSTGRTSVTPAQVRDAAPTGLGKDTSDKTRTRAIAKLVDQKILAWNGKKGPGSSYTVIQK